jgi:hypothetical protein
MSSVVIIPRLQMPGKVLERGRKVMRLASWSFDGYDQSFLLRFSWFPQFQWFHVQGLSWSSSHVCR